MSQPQSEVKKVLPTFANDDKVPPLPVPTLDETTRKYLKSLIPIVSNDQYQRTK